MNAVGIIFSNMHDNNVPELTRSRTMASVPFGGRYRMIDFALSNMVNSHISKVGVITRNNYQSLMDHLGSGKDWDLARKNGGLIILPPFGDEGSTTLYKSRLEALKGVSAFIDRSTEEYVILSDSDNICNIDIEKIFKYHMDNQADITVVCKTDNIEDGTCRVVTGYKCDKNNCITDVCSPLGAVGKATVGINLYVIKRTLLASLIRDAAARGESSFELDIIGKNLDKLKIIAYEHDGVFFIISNMQKYLECNLAMLDKKVRDELFNLPYRAIYTKVKDSPPTRYTNNAKVINSFIADGCEIDGMVENSIIFRDVKISKGSEVRNSVIMQNTYIGSNSSLNYCVTDKNVVVRSGRTLSGCEIQPYFLIKNSLL